MSKSLLLASAAIVAITIVGSAHAQTNPAPAVPQDTPAPADVPPLPPSAGADQSGNVVADIIVTGSLIRGTPKDAALPVAVVDLRELQQRGSPSTIDLIKSLPNVGAVYGESNQFNAGASTQYGVGSINLRSIGNQRTLVLMNGRRIVSSPGAASGGADTQMIPIAAIGRVEVLKDGAAATYGSDAIAGVVNFITRRNFSGLELNANYRLLPGSDGDWDVSAAWGVVSDRGNLLVTAGYEHRSRLRVRDRDFLKGDYLANPTGFSLNGNPGTYTVRNGTTNLTGPVQDANCGAFGGFQTYSGTTPTCAYYYMQFFNLVEDEDRYQIYAEGNYELTDRIKVHVEGQYSNTSLPNIVFGPSYTLTNGPNGPGGTGQYVIPASNPGFNTFLQQTGNAGLIGTATSAAGVLYRPLGYGGNPATGGEGIYGRAKNDLYRFSGGITAELSDSTSLDVSATYSRQANLSISPDILVSRFQSALNGLGGPNCTGTTPGANGCKYFNPFSNGASGNTVLGTTNPGYVSANANDPAMVAWLFDADRGFRAEQSLFVADAALSGRLGFLQLPGGSIGWAVGAQYRAGSFLLAPNDDLNNAAINPCPTAGVTTCTFKTGPYIYQGTYPNDIRLNDSIKAVFAELQLPVFDTLNVQAAARYEDYGGLTGATFNPKVSAKWQVVEPFALRGSVSTTFRGPQAIDRALVGTTQTLGITAIGNQFKPVDLFGNPAVQPEKAFNYSVGGILQIGGLTATVDYWHYKLKDQIVAVPANLIATSVAGTGNGSQLVNCASPLRDLITFDQGNVCTQGVTTANAISRIRSDTTNGPAAVISGLDFDIAYTKSDVFGGRLQVGLQASRILKYDEGAFLYNGVLVTPAYTALGFANYTRTPGTVSKLRGTGWIDYGHGIHNARLQVNYVSGVTDNRGPTVVQTGPVSGGCTVATATRAGCALVTYGLNVPSYYTFDFTYRVRLPWHTAATFTVYNILDRGPSLARLEYSYDPFIGSALGRSFKFGIQKTF